MNILAIDSKKSNLKAIEKQVQKDHNQFFGSTTSTQGISDLTTKDIDVVITNKSLPDGNGFDILKLARSQTPPSSVIIVSRQNTSDALLESLHLGATDYIPDPIDPKALNIAIHKAYEQRQMYLKTNIDSVPTTTRSLDFLQGSSDAMHIVFDQIRQSAPYKITVLITGESGTGKDLVARSIHALSPRAHEPFIAINCSAIPHELLESQLFGHEKGAFTSAVARQEGVFEVANNGTLFLDEIGNLALDDQAKLLRVLEDRQITRLGNTSPIDIDVRVIAATNTNIKQAVSEGRFREDLYYRLNVLNIKIPSLRERRTDIPLLVKGFLDDFAQENKMPRKNITEPALARLVAYDWPGNVRELKNITERVAVTTLSDTIDAQHLPTELQEILKTPDSHPDLTPFRGISLDDIEKMLIDYTLENTNGNRKETAQILGISLRTLQRKLKEYKHHTNLKC